MSDEKRVALGKIKKRRKEAFEHAVEAFKIHIAHHPESAENVQTISPIFERFFKAMETVIAWEDSYTKVGPDKSTNKITTAKRF